MGDCNIGVMEFWSNGVMGKWNNVKSINPTIHYSNIANIDNEISLTYWEIKTC
ncbi:hypothetical protein H8E88_21010 [candidate division KSB1 bacterium]|nr:hypothetical protein [candidate division KSB1 bacterium]MBL7092343.1 hypothetical protein [candidate division KSB1 bacterium]